MAGKHAALNWAPSTPGDPGWAGDTPWAGGVTPARWTEPDSGIDALSPLFPIRHSLPPSCFWEMAHQRPDRTALAGLTARARADEATHQETFVVPVGDTAPIPVIRVPRTYPPLYPEALARDFEAEVTHEFTEADRERLERELTMGRST